MVLSEMTEYFVMSSQSAPNIKVITSVFSHLQKGSEISIKRYMMASTRRKKWCFNGSLRVQWILKEAKKLP